MQCCVRMHAHVSMCVRVHLCVHVCVCTYACVSMLSLQPKRRLTLGRVVFHAPLAAWSPLAVVLLGLGLVAMWMHRAPAALDSRRTMTRAQGALRPLVSAPTRPQGGGLNAASAAAMPIATAAVATAAATVSASEAETASSLAAAAAARPASGAADNHHSTGKHVSTSAGSNGSVAASSSSAASSTGATADRPTATPSVVTATNRT